MPSSKRLYQLTVGIPPALAERFFAEMPKTYKRTVLIAAALDAFLDVDPTELHRMINDTAANYRMVPEVDDRSKPTANVRAEAAAAATKAIQLRLAAKNRRPREAHG